MLDNLLNPNLSGLTGTINYDNSVTIIPYLVNALIAFIVILFAFTFLMYVFNRILYPHSKRYRELMTDMYVVGRVKQFAIEDNIDLTEEIKEFGRLMKKADIDLKSIDKVVEEDIKERIAKSTEDRLK